MRFTRTTTIAALVAAAIGSASFAPVAVQAAPAAPEAGVKPDTPGMRPDMRIARKLDMRLGMGFAPRLVALVCSDKGADRLDRGLDHMATRLKLTDAQKPLFDDLRTAALAAQTSFADECRAARPVRAERADRADRATRAGRPDLIARLQLRLKIDDARHAAVTGLLPELEAFYKALTDEQKAMFEPRGKFHMRPGVKRPGAEMNG